MWPRIFTCRVSHAPEMSPFANITRSDRMQALFTSSGRDIYVDKIEAYQANLYFIYNFNVLHTSASNLMFNW